MATGTVKVWSKANGYGWIQPDGHADRVYVHKSGVVRRETEPGMHQCQGQRRLAGTGAAAQEQHTLAPEQGRRMEGKLVGTAIESLGQQLTFQHGGELVPGA